MMKDKLYKTHHKAAYYITRKTIIGVLCAFSLVAAIVVPTYISIKAKDNKTAGLAQEEPKETSSENEESENSEYEEYNDQ